MADSDALDTNLLRSSKSAKAPVEAADPAAAQAARRKHFLKSAAYTAFFLWALVTFTLVKIPDSVVANYLLNTLNQNTPYQWEAEKIGIGFFPAPHLEMQKLNLEPKFAGAGPALQIDLVRVYPNPFSLIPIGGAAAFGGSFRAEAYKAVLNGSFSMGKDLYVRVYTDSVDLSKITPLASRMSLRGTLSALDLKISMPGQRISAADGDLDVHAKNVQLDPSDLGLPFPLPPLNAGDLDMAGTITKGQLKIGKLKVGGAGKDLDLQVSNGTVTLSDMTPATRYDLHLQLKPSATLEKAVPGLSQTLGVFATQKPDGYYATHLTGTLGSPGFPVRD